VEARLYLSGGGDATGLFVVMFDGIYVNAANEGRISMRDETVCFLVTGCSL